MMWKGKEIKTIEHACNALGEIKTKEEAAEYLRLAREESSWADHNIGYLFGYFNRDKWKELSELFGITHPFFGTNYDLGEAEIMKMGMERGRAIKAKHAKK